MTTRTRQLGLFEQNGIGFEEAYNIALESFRSQVVGRGYKSMSVGFSGGKDSTTVVTLLAHFIKSGQLDLNPRNIWILYGDTGRELPPLHDNALALLRELGREGFNTKVVQPSLDKTFWVAMLGRGLPLPHNFSRWCVSHLKTDQMENVVRSLFYRQNQVALEAELKKPEVKAKFSTYTKKGRDAAITKFFNQHGKKLLMITGMRLGESLTRDQKIEHICTRNGECGTGMWQPKAPEYDRLAPLVRWRTCHIFDWLAGWAGFVEGPHGYETYTRQVARIYGDMDVRTGCASCSVAHKDTALENIVQNQKMPEYSYLKPLLKLRLLWEILMTRRNLRLWHDGTAKSQTKDLGPLTFEARRFAYVFVMKLQLEMNQLFYAMPKELQLKAGNSPYQIISLEERQRIFWHWANKTWPQGWDGSQPVGNQSQLTPTGQTEINWFGE
jgi:DNA sulfur modification protein DndC